MAIHIPDIARGEGRPSRCLRRLCLVLLLVALAVGPVPGAKIAAGSIAVRSVPGGASVTLDGVYQGLTRPATRPR